VPSGLKGKFTAELEYDTGPLPIEFKKAEFTIR